MTSYSIDYNKICYDYNMNKITIKYAMAVVLAIYKES